MNAGWIRTASPVPRALTLLRGSQIMPWLLGLYAVTSLLHFAHNAEFLAEYPNLPASWSRADVYLAWCAVTTVGILGYVLFRGGYRRLGLAVLGTYGGLGFAGLLHYARAPIAHHSSTMNLTIWTEVAAAAIFLINVVTISIYQVRPRGTTAA